MNAADCGDPFLAGADPRVRVVMCAVGRDRRLSSASTSDAGLVPVVGTLDFDTSDLRSFVTQKPRAEVQMTEVPARFDGHALAVGQPDVPMAVDVTLPVTCIGPWCPNQEPGMMVGFSESTGKATYAVSVDACGGFLFSNPVGGNDRGLARLHG